MAGQVADVTPWNGPLESYLLAHLVLWGSRWSSGSPSTHAPAPRKSQLPHSSVRASETSLKLAGPPQHQVYLFDHHKIKSRVPPQTHLSGYHLSTCSYCSSFQLIVLDLSAWTTRPRLTAVFVPFTPVKRKMGPGEN